MFRFVVVGWMTLALLAFAPAARASLILEMVQVPSITAGPATGPAMSSLNLSVGQTAFVQLELRDTTGYTVPWHDLGDPTGAGLFTFYFRITGIPGVLVNPGPASLNNARIVDPLTYFPVSNQSNQPIYTNFGGVLNAGMNSEAVPDPANQNRIALFNMRLLAIGQGTGTVQVADQSTYGVDSSLGIWYPGNGNNNYPDEVQSIDGLIFGLNSSVSFPFTFNVTPAPEPGSMMLMGLVAASAGWCSRRKRKAK